MYRKLPWYGEYCKLLSEKKRNEDDLRERNRALYEVDELKNRFQTEGADWTKNHWLSYQDYQKGIQEQIDKDFTSEIRKSINIANKIEYAVRNDTVKSMEELSDLHLNNHKYSDLVRNVLFYRRIKAVGINSNDVPGIFFEVNVESRRITDNQNKYIYHECLLFYVEKYVRTHSLSQDESVNEVFKVIKNCLSEYYLFNERKVELPQGLEKIARRCKAIINQRNS